MSDLGRSAAPAIATTSAAAGSDDTTEGRVVISEGHVDIGPRIVDGTWRIQMKDDSVSPVAWRDLSDVVLQAVEAAQSTVPVGSPFEFLGEAGDPIWLLPQAQQQGILWPGWNTQDPSVTSAITGPVAWKFLGVDGPGSLALFLTGSFGAPQVFFDADRPFPQPIDIEPDTHVHGIWAFGESGIYRISIEMPATAKDGPVSDRRTLTFAVGSAGAEAGFSSGGGTTTTIAGSGGGVPPARASAPRAAPHPAAARGVALVILPTLGCVH